MKVKLEIELDIPGIENMTEGEIQEVVSHAYTHYVTCKHLADAIKQLSLSSRSTFSDRIREQFKEANRYHLTWADITEKAVVNITIGD